jgi:HEAT repeat protein
MNRTRLFFSSMFVAALAGPAVAQTPAVPAVPAFPAIAALPAVGPLPSPGSMRLLGSPWGIASRDWDDRADELYQEGREAIEEGRFDRAVDRFSKLIELKTNRTDGALYWKAYSLAKLGQRDAALSSLSDLQKRFAGSRWSRDAKSLEMEVRQASGQTVTPESQNDEELKLLALRGIMQSDPEQALPIIEKMLTGANSPKVKDRALFVLSQSHSARAREIIAGVAKGNANPDLQLKAIQYLGIMNGADNRQLLADIYKSSSDSAVKKRILRSFMTSGDREHLLAVAKTETTPELRGDAVMQLGVMHAGAELNELYKSESSIDVKKRIIQAISVGDQVDRLIELAKGEKDPELRKMAIRNLGTMGRPGTAEALVAIYGSDASPDVRKAVVNGLFIQNNAKALVDLARAERNPEMKKEIVSKLSVMKSKEATDYLMELLK